MGQLYKVTVRVTEIEAVHFSQRAGTLHNALQNAASRECLYRNAGRRPDFVLSGPDDPVLSAPSGDRLLPQTAQSGADGCGECGIIRNDVVDSIELLKGCEV